MAERRMFAKTIIDSDSFLDMPLSTQALYFHLSMRADDDGFINSPKAIMRNVGCKDDDIKLLIAKKFIIPFESGVVVIKHWKIHNYIQKDRYKETVYKKEKQMLDTKENNAYTLKDTQCIQSGYKLDTQVRLGKDSIELELDNNIVEQSVDDVPYIDIINYLNFKTNSNYKHSTKKTRDLIKARFNEGFTKDDFIQVINNKTEEWQGTEMQKFLRPETLFGNKFEGYLNQKEVKPKYKKPAQILPMTSNTDYSKILGL